MKSHRFTTSLLLAASLLPATAFAKDKGKPDAKVSFAYTTQFGNNELAPGNYKLQWEGTGDTVQVNALQRGRVVATASAKLVESAKPADSSEVTYGTVGDKKTVHEIDFSKSKESLIFAEAQRQVATN
ncbi:MAG TPA: hypothetical protein VH079_05225 [Terriglobales bacterium]|jgi:hypothetical protein|nr:hypothetical protein [Terriglobales bacterium]